MSNAPHYRSNMPDLLEPPPQSRPNLPPEFIAHIFNPETASAAGKRSVEAKKQQKAALIANGFSPDQATAVNGLINGQLELVAEQIAHTRSLLNSRQVNWCPACERGGIEANHRAQLLRSFATLLEQQRKLLGIGDPAPRKADRQARVSAGWIELQPALPSTAPVAQVAPTAAPTPTVLEPSKLPGDVTP